MQKPPLTSRPKVYLAGPGVFLPNADEHGELLKRECERVGLCGKYPLDDGILEQIEKGIHMLPDMAAIIFRHDVQMIAAADAVIADITPFRGLSVDSGTAFEIGMAWALKKPVWAYSSHSNVTYAERALVYGYVAKGAETSVFHTLGTSIVDDDDNLIENLGETDNLMVTKALAAPPFLTFKEACAAAARHFGLEVAPEVRGQSPRPQSVGLRG